MSFKACVYKGCLNSSLHGITMTNGVYSKRYITLFQFPKDPDRRKKWMELGQVTTQVSSSEHLVMCSDHFDRKYWSITPRRTILVGTAVPYAYNEKEDAEASETELVLPHSPEEDQETYMILDDESVVSECEQRESKKVAVTHEPNTEQRFHVESTMQEDDEGNIIQKQHTIIHSEEKDQTTLLKKLIIKRTTPQTSTPKATVKRFKVSTSKPKTAKDPDKSLNKLPTKTEESPIPKKAATEQQATDTKQELSVNSHDSSTTLDLDESVLIDANEVSSFIFKGEEYVQMSKEHYVQEKLSLLRKIKKYEHTFAVIKNDIDSIDLS